MKIETIKYYIQSANVNFLYGSGLSRPFLAVLGNIEKRLTELNEERIDQLLQDKGYKEGEIAQFRTLLEYAEKYESLLNEQSQLLDENAALTSYIEAENNRIRAERYQIERAISQNGVYLLKHDQDRQAEFRNATDLRLDFEQNVA